MGILLEPRLSNPVCQPLSSVHAWPPPGDHGLDVAGDGVLRDAGLQPDLRQSYKVHALQLLCYAR